jgi:hypothetical protein
MVNFRNHNLVSTDHDTVLQIPVNTTKLIVKFTRVCLVYMPHQNIIFLNWNLINKIWYLPEPTVILSSVHFSCASTTFLR